MSIGLWTWFRRAFRKEVSSEGLPPISRQRLADLEKLQEILSYRFRNVILLDNALIHRSFANENPAKGLLDNERLEFLGDSVLQLCIADMLMKRFPDDAEGALSKRRMSVVSELPLANLAKRYQMGHFLLLGRGEESSGGKTKTSLLANTFEAVIAAIYLDGGYPRASEFIEALFLPLVEDNHQGAVFRDYKSALQEISQTRFKEPPRYTLIGEEGPDHDKTFEIRISIAGQITATGCGKSKREAEQQAAMKALAEMDRTRETL